MVLDVRRFFISRLSHPERWLPSSARFAVLRLLPWPRGWIRALLLLFVCATSTAQTPQPMQFTRLTVEDGLSQGAVMAIQQDRQGFLWLATEDGLDRYDGYEVRHYVHDRTQSHTLPVNYVDALALEPSGRLWIGMAGGGVIGRDPETGALEPLTSSDGSSSVAANEQIRVCYIDRERRLWVGTRDRGLVMVDPARTVSRRYQSVVQDPATIGSDSIFAVIEDASGQIWVGTQAGLDRLDPVNGRVVREPLRDWLHVGANVDLQVTTLLADRGGRIWVGTNAGLLRISPQAAEAVMVFNKRAGDARALPSDRVQALLEDSSKRLWIGTSNGLVLFDEKGAGFETYRHDATDPASLPDDSVISLYEDRGGLLWVGTKTGGAARWNPRSWSFGLHPRGGDMNLGDVIPSAFATDAEGTLWLATFGGGLHAIDRASGRVVHYRHKDGDPASLPDDRVMSVLVDHEDTVWAGTMSGGLARLNRRTGHFKVFVPEAGNPNSIPAAGVMSLLEDSHGRLWVGTYGGGVTLFDRATDRFTRYAGSNDTGAPSMARATALAEDRYGHIWVGTDGEGLCLLDPVSAAFKCFEHNSADPHGLSAKTVYALRIDARGSVWVGTRGGGLDEVVDSSLSPERIRFRNYSETQGLPNSTIYGIEAEASGRLWLSSNRGLTRLDPDSGEMRNFRRLHGLQGDEFNFGAHYRSPAGELFFGGPDGYNAFFPERLEFNQEPPPVVLTKFLEFNEPARLTGTPESLRDLKLGYRDSVITFEFAALDFASPRQNQYQYKLEGFDRQWVDAGSQHSVTYTNLSGGHYAFRARAANSDGVWNNAGVAVTLGVDPAPWETAWARAGYALAVGLVIFLVWHSQHRKLRREAFYAQRLRLEVRDRTAELAERNTELEQANERLREASVTDPLTGLGNRRHLYEAMAALASTATKAGRSFPRVAFLMVDLDHLKPVNDLHGHDAGDALLTGIADILRSCCRASDILVRWGGDEFIVAYLDADMNAAEQLAEKFRSTVAKKIFRLAEGKTARTSCSIGFVCHPFVSDQSVPMSWEQSLSIADAALYHAKKERNGWVGLAGLTAAAADSEVLKALEKDTDALVLKSVLEVRRPRFRPDDTVNNLQSLKRRRSDQ
jgi:diguanylate cyclase (GGDEF)-like protein